MNYESLGSGLRLRPDWMPDPGVHKYVCDVLVSLGADVEHIPEHWIPIAIIATLDWVSLCGWWILRYSGIFDSKEQYQWLFEYDGTEFDPDMLAVFRDEPARNKFAERVNAPGLTTVERIEALPFLRNNFRRWLADESLRGVTKEDFVPPDVFLEVAMWATFLWLLSHYGRDWVYLKDPVFACAIDFGVAYLSKFNNTLLDPEKMVCTKRPPASCRYCGEELWCVRGAVIDNHWQYICINCLNQLTLSNHEVDKEDVRIRSPRCPHIAEAGTTGTCMSHCPHSGMNEERFWTKLQEWGSQRVDEHERSMGGKSPRMVTGQTMEDIVNYFK